MEFSPRDIAVSFHPAVADRGRRFVEDRDVVLLPASDGKELFFGLVRIGSGRTVKVGLRVAGDPSGRVSFQGHCTCGSREKCPHAAALAWAALGKNAVTREGVIAGTPRTTSPTTHIETSRAELSVADRIRDRQAREQEQRRKEQLAAWLETVERVGAKENERATRVDTGQQSRRVLFILSLRPSAYSRGRDVLHVHPVVVSLTKRGVTGRPKPLGQYSGDAHPSLLTSDDRLILAMILNATYGGYSGGFYSAGPLRPEPAVEILERMLATGRCHWEDNGTPPLRAGEPLAARVEWVMDDEGRQRPRVVVDGARVITLPLEPLWYVDAAASTCGPMRIELPPKLVSFLEAAPSLLPEDVEGVRDQLLARLPGISIPLPVTLAVDATEESPVPVPVLRLAGITARFSGWVSGGGPAGFFEPVAYLAFRYGDVIARALEPGHVIRRAVGAVLRSVRRDPAFEMRCVKRLERLEITPGIAESLDDLDEGSDASSGRFDVGMDADDLDAYLLDLGTEAVPALRREGWEVVVEDTFPCRVVTGDETWYADVRPEAKSDWFDLELGVEIEGERISLLPVLLRLLRDPRWSLTPDQIASLPDDGFIPVPLPDGRVLPLATRRARTILGTLAELHATETLGGQGALRLSTWNSSRLADLEQGFGKEGLLWSGGEALLEVGARLRDFRGIRTGEAPEGFAGTLRPYQQHGLDWLQFLREHGLAGILADDMGLGKTVQVLAHLLVEKRSGRMDRPSLVVAPTSLMPNWLREAERFAPDLRVLVLQGLARKQHFERLLEHDVVLTTYPLLPRDEEVLTAHEFHLIILDEAQFLKNAKAKASAIARRLRGRHRLALTGTPMENHLGELWAIFDLLLPGLLGDERVFRKLFRTPIEKHGSVARRDQLTARIRPFLLRRTKNEVEAELPPKTEIVQVIELEKAQRDLYESIRLAMHEKVQREVAAKGVARSTIIILDALLKLRQVCCDPALLKIKEAQRVRESAKRSAVMEMLAEMMQEGRRVLLFSQFTSMIELLETDLAAKGIEYVKLVGDTRDREKPVKRFQSGEVALFLISLKAGGTGLNLPAADTVIHYDPWWNPAVEDQATDRAHRIGQDKPVFVYKLIAAGSVEEKILALQARKRELARGIYGEEAKLGGQLSPEDLEALFRPIG